MGKSTYISALRFKWLTPLYDFFINVTMPEKKIKQVLMEAANISVSEQILDFGCGTATLTIMVKQLHPEAKVAGIDVDLKVLDMAIQKVKKKKLNIFLLDYDGVQLPFQRNAFDKVISCLVFHHLNTVEKQEILAELFRIMRSNGELIIADFGRSKSWMQRTLFNMIRVLDGFKSTDANAKGLLPELIGEAGFEKVFIRKYFRTMLGEVQIISAEKI